MASIKIPDELKAEVPLTLWGKILSATPVVMTVVATALAGLASSEMTRAQYVRSLAAQQQSKAGDQWSFFQAKRLRGSLQRNALDILQSTSDVRPFDAAAVVLDPPVRDLALPALQTGALPALAPAPAMDVRLKAALAALEGQQSDEELTALLAQVEDQTLHAALRTAQERAKTFDVTVGPVNQVFERLDQQLAGGDQAVRRNFTAARLRYTAGRYDAEARLNQAIANIYELQVRKSNHEAERHHTRSQRFFYGMLAAQAAVIVATFAIAARKRNLLWSLAAAAGVAAVGFAAYVFLFV